MTTRDNRVYTYVTDDEKADLEDYADEAGKSVSQIVRQAIREYTDNDRAVRVESKVDELAGEIEALRGQLAESEHTHTRAPDRASSTVEKAREIAQRVYRNHDPPIQEADVHRAIEDIAGADDRTVEKYTGLLKGRNLLYRHPTSAVWTDDREQFVEWADATTVGDTPDCLEEYDIGDEEFMAVAEEVAQR